MEPAKDTREPENLKLGCGHVGPNSQGKVCTHLLAVKDKTCLQRFTGSGLAFDLVCSACRQNPAEVEANLRHVCQDCFRVVERERYWDGIIGQPQILVRRSNLRFRHEIVALPELRAVHIVDVQPLLSETECIWIALTADGRLLRVDLANGSVRLIAIVPASRIDVATTTKLHFCEWDHLRDSRAIAARQDLEPIAMHLSDCGRLGAIVQTHGRYGIVVDLNSGRKTMDLDRGEYHEDVSSFPVAFTKAEGKLVIIHGTDWNRLDISDAVTGELLTSRTPTSYNQGETRPEHYLNYFHCSLSVSPGGDFVADNGWVWHPAGIPTTWSLQRWLKENVWESEDGPSKKSLCLRTYYWDGPVCWINAKELAVFGYGEDDEWLVPAACIYDVVSGKMVRWFAGPNGKFFYDRYLFSSHKEAGTSVWDVATGEQILRDPFCPNRYHPGAKVFLTPRLDNTVVASRLEGDQAENEKSHLPGEAGGVWGSRTGVEAG